MDTAMITMDEFLSKIKKNIITKNFIPMELGIGWPVLLRRNNELCVIVPFFKTVLRENDNTLIYPISYTITATWPNGIVVDYSNLRYDKAFKKVDFTKPVGKFRHEAVKDLNKKEYIEKRKELFSLYDGLIECILKDKEFDYDDQKRFSQIFSIMMEPSLLPFYMTIGDKFINNFYIKA